MWTIGELAGRAAALLSSSRSEAGVGDGRVREVPNERLIRWYTTIGLLDPPLARRGRVALYGRRHLLQLVAVKRRQADGRSIAAIQAELAGATDAMLQRIAALPADPPYARPASETAAPASVTSESTTTPAGVRHGTATTTGTTFGNTTPAGAARGTADGTTPAGAAPAGIAHADASAGGASEIAAPTASRGRFWARDTTPAAAAAVAETAPVTPAVVSGVRLAPGVTVLLEGRAPTPEELTAIGRAAGPLLATLTELGLGGT